MALGWIELDLYYGQQDNNKQHPTPCVCFLNRQDNQQLEKLKDN